MTPMLNIKAQLMAIEFANQDLWMRCRRVTEDPPKWEWGHERAAEGMVERNMCGPFFGRNLSGIISWMQSKTSADLNAWHRRVLIEDSWDEHGRSVPARWVSLSDLALEVARQHSGTWPHHFLVTHIDIHAGNETYCKRCGASDEFGIPEACVKSEPF